MTDCFALLEQPRAAWLDLEQLKEAFHSRTMQAHPDAQGSNAEFAQLNEAYQVLREPKRRLQHLLALSGAPPLTQSAAIPAEVAALFPAVAELTRRADTVLAKSRGATSALARSLVQAEVSTTQKEIEALLGQLQAMFEAANDELRAAAGPDEWRELSLLFSYLTRWLGELREKQLQFTL